MFLASKERLSARYLVCWWNISACVRLSVCLSACVCLWVVKCFSVSCLLCLSVRCSVGLKSSDSCCSFNSVGSAIPSVSRRCVAGLPARYAVIAAIYSCLLLRTQPDGLRHSSAYCWMACQRPARASCRHCRGGYCNVTLHILPVSDHAAHLA